MLFWRCKLQPQSKSELGNKAEGCWYLCLRSPESNRLHHDSCARVTLPCSKTLFGVVYTRSWIQELNFKLFKHIAAGASLIIVIMVWFNGFEFWIEQKRISPKRRRRAALSSSLYNDEQVNVNLVDWAEIRIVLVQWKCLIRTSLASSTCTCMDALKCQN